MLLAIFVVTPAYAAPDICGPFLCPRVAYYEDLPTPEPAPLTPAALLRELIPDERTYRRAAAIVNAESGWKPAVKNPASSASGLFQFIDGTFKSFCIDKYGFATSMDQKNDPTIQIECGAAMLNAGLESHWNASRHIWGNVQ